MSEKSPVLKELREMVQLLETANCNEKQIQWYKDMIKAAKPVKCVRAASVLDEYQLEYVRHVIKPEPKKCYRNAFLLTQAFPDILYVEGKTLVPCEIDHAFNKVGDKYIDITFEFALEENPKEYPYISLLEYDARTVRKLANESGYLGEFYRYEYEKAHY